MSRGNASKLYDPHTSSDVASLRNLYTLYALGVEFGV